MCTTSSTLQWCRWRSARQCSRCWWGCGRGCVTGTYTPSRGWTPTNTSPICSPTIAKEPADPPVPAVKGKGLMWVVEGRVDMSGRARGWYECWERVRRSTDSLTNAVRSTCAQLLSILFKCYNYYYYYYYYCYYYYYNYSYCYYYFSLPMPENDSRSPHCFCILPVAASPSQPFSCVWGTSCNRTRTPSSSTRSCYMMSCKITSSQHTTPHSWHITRQPNDVTLESILK